MLVSLATVGCGGSTGPPAVHLSLIAPTNGASVVASHLYVTGSVQPAAAKVVIDGRAVASHDGRFGEWISVRRGVSHIRVDAKAEGLAPDVEEVAVRSDPPAEHRSRHEAAPQSLSSIAGLSSSTWTSTVRTEFVKACEAEGGWQSYCECALPYAMAAGVPRQLEESSLAARAQRRLPYWVKRVVTHCL